MAKLLFVPLTAEALEQLCRRAGSERRRPQDEAALLIERALGLRDTDNKPGQGREPRAEDTGARARGR